MTADTRIREYRASDEAQVISVWQRCGLVMGANDPVRDIAAKVAVQPELFLVAEQDDSVVGTVMAGYDGHRGWIHLMGVHPDAQRRGLGRILVAEAERRLRALGCSKLNLQVRASNSAVVAFYERLGYEVEPRISMGKRLS